MKRNILLCIIMSGFSLKSFSQSPDIQNPITITPNISIQNFDWVGRSTVGSFGVEVGVKTSKKINLSVTGNVFKSLGNVDNFSEYTAVGSAIIDKAWIPISTPAGMTQGFQNLPKTTFQGGFVNIDAGIPIKLGDSSRTTIEPFVGIEGKMWNRSSDYGTEGNPLIFEEKYKFLSPSLGAKLNFSTKSKVKLSLRISASYPVVSKLKTDSKSLVNPNSEIDLTKWLSPSVELGVRAKKITLKLRYERINMGTADTIRGTLPNVNVTGISIGYDF